MGILTQLALHAYRLHTRLPRGPEGVISSAVSGRLIIRVRIVPPPQNHGMHTSTAGNRWREHHYGAIEAPNRASKGHDA